MRRVAFQVLQRDLRSFVRAASDGETVLVTDENRIVAELGPPRPTRNRKVRTASGVVSDDEFVRRGVREGWLTPAIERGPPPQGKAPSDFAADLSLDELLDELARDREDR